MNYEELIKKEILKEEKISFDEISKLVEKAHQKIKSAYVLVKNNDAENGFQFAYEAMLLAGRGLVFSHNLRPRALGSHKIVVEFVKNVLGEEYRSLVEKFNKARIKRNYLIYGIGLVISPTDAENAIKTAENFVKIITEFIEKKNPQRKLITNNRK